MHACTKYLCATPGHCHRHTSNVYLNCSTRRYRIHTACSFIYVRAVACLGVQSRAFACMLRAFACVLRARRVHLHIAGYFLPS